MFENIVSLIPTDFFNVVPVTHEPTPVLVNFQDLST